MNTMPTQGDRPTDTAVTRRGLLAVAVRTELDGPVVRVEDVTEDDLAEAVSEIWLEEFLRAGRPDVDPVELAQRGWPVADDPGDGATTYVLEVEDPNGRRARRSFSIHSLGHVADRAARRLREEGVLSDGELYYYDLHQSAAPWPDGDHPRHGPEGADPTSVGGPRSTASFTVEHRRRPLCLMSVPLRELMDRATPRTGLGAGPRASRRDARGASESDRFHPVFYTEAAAAKSEAFSRKGESATPPEETGGVLVGPACVCPETGEFFTVVSEVYEATDAVQSEFSLAYSGSTWSRIQRVVRALQAQPHTAAYRILGQCHGHSFLPADGAPPCEACAEQEECSRTSVFVSSHDLNWNRAVFARQPWKLCHIYGWNARREQVEGLFGLRDARLLRRGYHVIPGFDPAKWAGPIP